MEKKLQKVNKKLRNNKKQSSALILKQQAIKRKIAELRGKPIENPYEIILVDERSNRKFTTYFDEFRIQINRKTIELNPMAILREILNKVIKKRGLKDGDRIRLLVDHNKLDRPLSTKYLKIENGMISMLEVIYQTRGKVFHQISKHREVDWKNEAQPSFFKPAQGVWKSDETLFRVFDIASQTDR